MNTHRLLVALITSLGVAALAWPSVHTPVARIVYNPSDSVPRGWYRVGSADSLHVSSIVLAQVPADAAALAAQITGAKKNALYPLAVRLARQE
mgnify:CR=1 FL=1